MIRTVKEFGRTLSASVAGRAARTGGYRYRGFTVRAAQAKRPPLLGPLPFHGEKTASFSVDPERQMYYCFGCKAGGSVIQFVMDMEHVEFVDAVKHLAEQVHMELPPGDVFPGLRAIEERTGTPARGKRGGRALLPCAALEE